MGSRILLSGATGMVGQALIKSPTFSANQICQLTRRAVASSNFLAWNFKDPLTTKQLSGFNVVVHLAGENISSGRWSPQLKAKIRDSRIESTSALSKSLAALPEKPKVFICASAVGYYGDRGDESLTEASPPGVGYLAEVCRDWESATVEAANAGIRVINLRTGVVLSKTSGALKKVLPAFRLGLGGALGDGMQFMSWISLPDLVRTIEFCIENESISGPVNAVSPSPCTNLEFSKILAAALHRRLGPRIPAFVLRLALGEMADALLLASIRVYPEKLLASKFQFQHPELQRALAEILGDES